MSKTIKRRQSHKGGKNAEKIAYLEQYYEAKNLERRLSEDIDGLCLTSMQAKSPKYDGMPHGHDTERDLSDLMAKLDREFSRLFKQQKKAIEIRQDIEKSINALENEKEKMVLWLRYIKFYSWEMVAIEMSYSYNHVIRLHDMALNNLHIK